MKLKSPLKAKPHRYAGQSLDDEIDNQVIRGFLHYYLISGMLLIMAGLEWFRSINNTPPTPWFYTIAAVISIGVTVFMGIRTKGKIKRLKQARDGERAIGQYLETFRSSGCIVFHDIQGNNFNLDHVLISPKGVFAIETKSYSKPARGKPLINASGTRLKIDGKQNQAIHTQLIAQQKWLSELVSKLRGKKTSARAAVLFPGWFIEGRFDDDLLWVLNPKALGSYMDALPDQYEAHEVKQMANLLSMHLREQYT